MDEHASPSEVAKKKKGHIPISTNLAYGQVEREGDIEYEMYDVPSGAAMAMQEVMYET